MTLRTDTDAALAAERASSDADIMTLTLELATANSRIASLEAELAQYRTPVITPSDNVQVALDAAVGKVKMEGTFRLSRPLIIPAGLVVEGPATIVSTALDAVVMKPNSTVKNLDISGAERHGINLDVGSTVAGGRLHHNGKDGAGGDLEGREGATVVISNCEIDHNGSAGWLGKGAAGVKMFHTRSFAIDDCWVHDNIGNGVWGDAHCGDFDVLNCRIEGNSRKGVFYEKCGESDGSFGGRTWAVYTGALYVSACTITDNDTETTPAANAGVSIISSKNARVVDCTFGGQARAVTVRDDPNRLADDKHGWVPENITIQTNTLNGTDIVGCDLPGVACLNNG